VRQIRSAFGDSASEPTYVETLPKRGYRLMRPVEPVEPAAAGGPAPGGTGEPGSAPVPGRWRSGWRPVAAVGLPALLLVLLLASGPGLARGCRAPGAPGSQGPIRLAIMPFELASAGGEAGDLARISEWLVAELSGGWGGRLEVIGPRSTAAYSAFPFPQMDRLGEDLSVDFVLNARLLDRDGERQLIVELIRLDDGAHPWAEYFADTRSWEPIARRVRDATVAALRLPPRTQSTDEE
jgi:TolB-like protein